VGWGALSSNCSLLTERRHGVPPKLGVGQQVGGQVFLDKVGGVRAAVAWWKER